MRVNWIAVAVVAGMAVLGFVAWKSSTQPPKPEPSPAPQAVPQDMGSVMPVEPADPGIEWTAPRGWTAGGERSMRLATYTIAGAGGEGPAECAVFYFGPGQGGTADANIERWLGEFQNGHDSRRSGRTVHGLSVSLARARGAYHSHGGATAPEGGADQQLMGAIVEGPMGLVFFKLTGPAATVDRAAADFDRMIDSVRKK